MADDSSDFTARQQAHAEQVRLERNLMRQSGKSLSEVRRSLRSDDRFEQLAAADSVLGRSDQVQPREQQRPTTPVIAVTNVVIPKKPTVIPNTVAPPDAGSSSSGGGGGSARNLGTETTDPGTKSVAELLVEGSQVDAYRLECLDEDMLSVSTDDTLKVVQIGLIAPPNETDNFVIVCQAGVKSWAAYEAAEFTYCKDGTPTTVTAIVLTPP